MPEQPPSPAAGQQIGDTSVDSGIRNAPDATAPSRVTAPGRPSSPPVTEDVPAASKRAGTKRIVMFVAVLLLVAGIVWGVNYWRYAATHVSTDDAYVVGDLVSVSPTINGTLKELSVDEGSFVHKGQLIARLSDAAPQASLRQARANYNAALSQIPEAERSLLFQQEATNAAIRKAQFALEADRSKSRGAEAQVELTRGTTVNQIKQAQSQISAAEATHLQSVAEARAADAAIDLSRQAIQTSIASQQNYEQQALTSQKAVAAAQARADAAQSELDRTTRDEARYASLFAQDAVSAQAYDNAKSQARSAAANLQSSRAQVEEAQSQAESAKAGSRQAQSMVESARKALAQAVSHAAAVHKGADAASELIGVARAGLGLARANSEQVGVQRANLASTKSLAEESQADIDAARAGSQQIEVRRSQIGTFRAQAQQALAALNNAEINLGHTKIYAPTDGKIVKRISNIGSSLAPGQTILTMTEGDHLWVEANYKETQLSAVRPGQNAEIEVDGIPGKVFRATVHSINEATGAATSLLPPDNATGNFTKVVQRIPVRIEFVPATDGEDAKFARSKDIASLRQGMSVTSTISVRENGSPSLKSTGLLRGKRYSLGLAVSLVRSRTAR